ncbi:8071_t:CDS:2 [Scutellospora calospora]|uniref:8071_t:CDS:1 n=1 Tax=Scutellospora calospora TaxID=85575 RepID=A0ACA9JUI3_9GLOM|nr:8071_t:CDS:2 [Scutellospora calospora]
MTTSMDIELILFKIKDQYFDIDARLIKKHLTSALYTTITTNIRTSNKIKHIVNERDVELDCFDIGERNLTIFELVMKFYKTEANDLYDFINMIVKLAKEYVKGYKRMTLIEFPYCDNTKVEEYIPLIEINIAEKCLKFKYEISKEYVLEKIEKKFR